MVTKPTLTTLGGDTVNDIAKLAGFFERVTGRRPTPEELEEAKEILAEENTPAVPDAHHSKVGRMPDSENADDITMLVNLLRTRNGCNPTQEEFEKEFRNAGGDPAAKLPKIHFGRVSKEVI